MIDQQPTIERLEAAGCARVEGVIEWAGLKSAPPQLPAHFVVPESETAAPAGDLVGAIDQKVTEIFRVVVVIRGEARRGSKASADLQTAVKKAKDAIFGWKHPDADGGTRLAGGRLLEAGGGIVAWAIRFSTTHHERTAA